MNIDQYRAMVAQEQAQKDSGKEQPNVQATQTPNVDQTPQTQTTQETTTPSTETTTQTTPSKITIDGLGEVTLDELKNGYLRQSDYTKKTQEIAKTKKELEEAEVLYRTVKSNPMLAQQLAQTTGLPPSVDPATAKVAELENKLYDLMLEREIDSLSSKYNDFDVREVLNEAHQKGITNLEDAYFAVKGRKSSSTPATSTPAVDVEALKQQLRNELLQEIQGSADTSTIIRGNDRPPSQQEAPKISAGEVKVASMMRMTPEEYIKWRDTKK
jgi:hypothetical protein